MRRPALLNSGSVRDGSAVAETERLIARAERRAERIVSLVRIAVAIGLALVFNVAVRGSAPAEDEMLLRQLFLARATIAGYALIGLLSLLLSVQRFHRRWFAYLFVTLDVAFLVFSVELALLNTGLGPRYTVVMPSIWLVPAILAFGAMRYSPWAQLYCTILIAGGLLWLSSPNLLAPEAPGAERAVLTAMFSDPANIMRIAMVTLAGAVLVVAAFRARRLLIEAMRRERQRQSLTKYMPPEVARLVEQEAAEELRAGREQEVVVVFIDIRGFTGRTEWMAPEEVSQLLAHFRAELREAAERWGGVIDKFIGDGAIVLFGVPEPRADDPARAVSFGREVLDRLAAWPPASATEDGDPLRVGIGMHVGTVFVGAVGDDERLEFTVLGDVVNVASRVEHMTRRLDSDLVVTRDVLERSGETWEGWRAVPAMPVRGRAEAVDVFALEQPASERAVPSSPRSRAD